MRGAIPLLPQYAFMAWCLVKQRGNFAFYHLIQTGSGDHPASNALGAEGSFPGYEAARA